MCPFTALRSGLVQCAISGVQVVATFPDVSGVEPVNPVGCACIRLSVSASSRV